MRLSYNEKANILKYFPHLNFPMKKDYIRKFKLIYI